MSEFRDIRAGDNFTATDSTDMGKGEVTPRSIAIINILGLLKTGSKALAEEPEARRLGLDKRKILTSGIRSLSELGVSSLELLRTTEMANDVFGLAVDTEIMNRVRRLREFEERQL